MKLVAAVVTAAVIGAISMQSLRHAAAVVRLDLAIGRARVALDDPDAIPARIVAAPGRTCVEFIARSLPVADTRTRRMGLASELATLSRSGRGDKAARALGVASLLAGKCDDAAVSFDRILHRSASDWNDLAAANLCAGVRSARPDWWLAALTAVDTALTHDATLIEAEFNRAKIVDTLGIAPTARSHWERYSKLDSSSRWAPIARQRLVLFGPSDTEAWKAATVNLEKLPDSELRRLTNRYPQAARKYADVIYLSSWAAAIEHADQQGADVHFGRIRLIAETLRRRGEPLLGDAVRAIDRTAADPHLLGAIVAGQLAYQKGRLLLRDGDVAEAEKHLRTAARLLAGGGSPTAAVAEFWLACALTEQHRTREALDLIVSLLGDARRYPSLTGHLQYQRSLVEASLGNWTVSLDAAQKARAAFVRIGERGNVANADAMLSEDYDLLGQHELAWQHGLAALHDSAADGALDRTRVTLAALCRAELRGGRWERALSMARLEAELAMFTSDVRLEPDLFIRRATAAWHLAESADARRWLQLARKAAQDIADPATRAKLMADVDAVEGVFCRRSDPGRAVGLLSAAIAFQKSAARPIILPELYLERGRAHIASNHLSAAEADFEEGLVELERQRTRVSDVELRPGIFSDASALFEEAIALQIRQGARAEDVFAYVERGRARAVLEQISGETDASSRAQVPRISDVQQVLGRSTALIEYMTLPDRLIIFVIAPDRVRMHSIPVARIALADAARVFADSRGTKGGRLYEMLIGPLSDDLRLVSAVNIVTDDVLQRVPFAALRNPRTGAFLVQEHAIASSPSAGVLRAVIGRTHRLRHVSASALLFGNPTIPREEFGDLAQLAASESEVRQIARYYSRSEVFVRDAATAERFYELAPVREVVHFSGHGVVNYREPYASALVCAATSEVPGSVTTRDIAKMRFRLTRVVILAACSTLAGRNAAVEGVPSLSRAFLVAGVPSVIGTLWDVSDTEAAAITRPLHERIAHGTSPVHALRAAQLTAIERGLPVSQWAAFQLMGSADDD